MRQPESKSDDCHNNRAVTQLNRPKQSEQLNRINQIANIAVKNSEPNSTLYVPKPPQIQQTPQRKQIHQMASGNISTTASAPLAGNRNRTYDNDGNNLKRDIHKQTFDKSDKNRDKSKIPLITVKKKKKKGFLNNILDVLFPIGNTNKESKNKKYGKAAKSKINLENINAYEINTINRPKIIDKTDKADKSDIANLFIPKYKKADTHNKSEIRQNQPAQQHREINNNQINKNINNNQHNQDTIQFKKIQPQNQGSVHNIQMVQQNTGENNIKRVIDVQKKQNNKNITNKRNITNTEKNQNMAQTAKTVSNNNVKKKIHPVKRLKNRFRKNGLNIIDSYFNAYFFYYIWKSEKKGRKLKKSLETMGNHPIGWSLSKTDDSLYEKNAYDRYITYLTVLSKFVGFISWILAPVRTFFKTIGVLFLSFENPQKASGNAGILAGKTANSILPAVSIVFTVLAVININAYRPETELWINGERIGLVNSKEVAPNASSLVESHISAILNEPYEFAGTVKYKIVLAKTPSYVSESEVYNVIYNYSQGVIMSAYGLYIDGELVGAAVNESEINQVLTEVLQENTDQTINETIEFANDIRIIPKQYSKRDVITQDELKNIITSAGGHTETAIIEDNTIPLNRESELPQNGNDTAEISEFSEMHDVSELSESSESSQISDMSALSATSAEFTVNVGEDVYNTDNSDDIAAAAAHALNLTGDEVNLNSIPRGDVSSLADTNDASVLAKLAKSSASVSPSVIQFKKTRPETYTSQIPFEVKYVNSDKYYVGTQTVQTKGVNGERKITAEVTYIGDEEISREIKSVETIVYPVDKVVLVGTKQKPSQTPTGKFIRPVRGGYVTSRFSSGGHRGIDLVVPYGTPITAADGGTVIYAGFSGSYGNHVKIRHNNGIVTLYAHMSSIGTKQGDKVFQGQEIGKVGSTGYSTGNHLHFEIIKDGVTVNPESYGVR